MMVKSEVCSSCYGGEHETCARGECVCTLCAGLQPPARQEDGGNWHRDNLGWDFGNDGSALLSLRGLLEQPHDLFEIGRDTLYDALKEHKDLRKNYELAKAELAMLYGQHERDKQEREGLRAALREVLKRDFFPSYEACDCGGDPHPGRPCGQGSCECQEYTLRDADVHELRQRIAILAPAASDEDSAAPRP